MRVYVSDLVLPVRIGVHDRERNASQKVRFSVAVEVGPGRASAGSDYFSYEIIMDAIAEATSGGHVDLAETLAERIAATILHDSRAERVTVKVEKLEIAAGILGIELVFDREGGRP